MALPPADMSYDAVENILYVALPSPVHLETREQIAEHFERVTAFWRANAGGKKAYFVIELDNIDINPEGLEHYARESKRLHENCAIAAVRYGGSPAQRTTARLAGMKLARPSNLCASRAEALAAVRAMKRGER